MLTVAVPVVLAIGLLVVFYVFRPIVPPPARVDAATQPIVPLPARVDAATDPCTADLDWGCPPY